MFQADHRTTGRFRNFQLFAESSCACLTRHINTGHKGG